MKDILSIEKITLCDVDEVKTCPFCGGNAIYINEYEAIAGARYEIICGSCMARINPGWAGNRYMVIDMWNNRVTEQGE